jgi:hypothetical protein
VKHEAGWWLKNRSAAKKLVLLAEGDLTRDKSAGDFDWSVTTAMRSNLLGQSKEVPLYVDLRWAKAADDLSLRQSRFRSAVLSVAAPVPGSLGVSQKKNGSSTSVPKCLSTKLAPTSRR